MGQYTLFGCTHAQSIHDVAIAYTWCTPDLCHWALALALTLDTMRMCIKQHNLTSAVLSTHYARRECARVSPIAIIRIYSLQTVYIPEVREKGLLQEDENPTLFQLV